jgi:hypothetical protein
MPNLPISQLPEITTGLTANAEFAVAQSGVTYKVKRSYLGVGIFSQTGNSTTVSGTTSETTIVGSGVGSLSVPANGFTVGDSYQCKIVGDLGANNNDTLTLRVKSDSVTLGTTGAIQMPGVSNKHFVFDINFTIRALGAAGVASIVSTGFFTFNKDASNAFEGGSFSTINNTTFDTTTVNNLNITVQFSSTNAANSLITEFLVLNKIY